MPMVLSKCCRMMPYLQKITKLRYWILHIMERFTLSLGKLAAILTGIIATLVVLPLALADENMRLGEDYYGNNIDAAILEANQNKRTVNYTNKYWYNRTTSKSFQLPNLAKDELEKESLPGALGATAAGGENVSASLDPTENDQMGLVQKSNSQSQDQQITNNTNRSTNTSNPLIEPTPIPIADISAIHTRGDRVSTRDIHASSILISTPRP